MEAARMLPGSGGGLEPPPAACPNSEAAYARGVRCFSAWHELTYGEIPTLPLDHRVVHEFARESLQGLSGSVAAALKERGIRRDPGAPAAVSTVSNWLSALSIAQASAGYTEPVVTSPTKLLLRRSKKEQAMRQEKIKTRPIDSVVLERILATCGGGTLVDIRDRALILVAIESGGRRASELENLRVEHLFEEAGGFAWVMPWSKTDEGDSRDTFHIAGRAAEGLKAWFERAGIQDGYVFRSLRRGGKVKDGSMGRSAMRGVLRRRIKKAGLVPEQFSPHSLRYGFIVQASARGESLFDVMAQTGHRSAGTLIRYYNRGRAFAGRNVPQAAITGHAAGRISNHGAKR